MKNSPQKTIKDPLLADLTDSERKLISQMTREQYLFWYKTRRALRAEAPPPCTEPPIGKPQDESIAAQNRRYLQHRALMFRNSKIEREKMLAEFVPIRLLQIRTRKFYFYDIFPDGMKDYYLLASPAGEIYDSTNDALVAPRITFSGRDQNTARYQVFVRVRKSDGTYARFYISVDRLIAATFLDAPLRNRYPMFQPDITHKLKHRNENLMDNRAENLFYVEVDKSKLSYNAPFVSDLVNPWEG